MVSSVMEFLGERVLELTRIGDVEHWIRRLKLLLQRPQAEGPVLTLLLDGLNQNAGVAWIDLFRVLRSSPFAGRVHIIVSTRPSHFEGDLAHLRAVKCQSVEVGPYDDTELDQMLSNRDLSRGAFLPELLELARIPRLFDLVVKFKDRFVEAGQVTVHRLLWEYGRETFGSGESGSFTEPEWHEWLKDVARHYRNGVDVFSAKLVEETVARPGMGLSEVRARLSSIVDGRFFKHDGHGEVRPSEIIVFHALGAALLWHLAKVATKPDLSVASELSKWLDPIAGLDERAEVLRAATSILVESGDAVAEKIGSAVVVAWLQSQNLPSSHHADAIALAPWVVEEMLDTIEESSNRAFAAARELAVRALCCVPMNHHSAIQAILDRARSWFCIVPRRVDCYAHDEDHRRSRAAYWQGRVGEDRVGRFKVLGVDITLVDLGDPAIECAAVRLMQRFPLEQSVPVMEAAAIAFSLTGHDDGWEAIKWACLLNERDPDETAQSIRQLALDIRTRSPEIGIHPQLSNRVAFLLLRLSGDPADDAAAVGCEPRLDGEYTYEEHYLASPGTSFFALERRHADSVLADTSIPFYRRLGRVRPLMIDPTFVVSSDSAAELVSFARSLDLTQTDRSSSRTSEDHTLEEILPALARFAPDVLAELVRRQLRLLESCDSGALRPRALHAPQKMLLAGDQEVAAIAACRARADNLPLADKAFILSSLLMVEIRNLDPYDQIERLIRADLDPIYSALEHAFQTPSREDVDRLLDRYGNGTDKRQRDLLYLLSMKRLDLSDRAWRWVIAMSESSVEVVADIAYEVLARTDAGRFGEHLLAGQWRWRATCSAAKSHYGSLCLIEATRASSFDEVARRISPSLLWQAIRVRGEDHKETLLAAEIVDRVLAASSLPEPDLGCEVTAELENGRPMSLHIGLRTAVEDADPMQMLKRAFDPQTRENHDKAVTEAVAVAISRTKSIRESGGSLFLVEIDRQGMLAFVRHAWPVVETWLVGMGELTDQFRRRVQLAELTYISLCEALLISKPALGVELWRALRQVLRVRYLGSAGVDELTHAAFRAPDSPEVVLLREQLVAPPLALSDKALLDVVVAAHSAGRVDAIDDIASQDRVSGHRWRRRRGEILSAFSRRADLPLSDAWPDGPIQTSAGELKRIASRLAWRDSCARHWWAEYMTAQQPEAAFASWTLFLNAVDRRGWTWMFPSSLFDTARPKSVVAESRRQFALHNESQLTRAVEHRERDLKDQYLLRRICRHIAPWESV